MTEIYCYWSHKPSHPTELVKLTPPRAVSGQNVFVLPEFQDKLEGFLSYVDRYSKVFLGSVFLSVVMVAATLFLRTVLLGNLAVVLLGVTFILFPFATSTTYELMGVRAATLLGRVTGSVFVVAGILLLIA